MNALSKSISQLLFYGDRSLTRFKDMFQIAISPMCFWSSMKYVRQSKVPNKKGTCNDSRLLLSYKNFLMREFDKLTMRGYNEERF